MINNEYLKQASNKLSLCNTLSVNGGDVQIAAILPHCPLLSAPWHKGSEVHIIAVDVNGNFFLRDASGAVNFWDHSSQDMSLITSSIKTFAALIKEAG